MKFGGGGQYAILYRNWDLGSPGYYEFANTVGPTPQQDGVLASNGTIYSATVRDSLLSATTAILERLPICFRVVGQSLH